MLISCDHLRVIGYKLRFEYLSTEVENTRRSASNASSASSLMAYKTCTLGHVAVQYHTFVRLAYLCRSVSKSCVASRLVLFRVAFRACFTIIGRSAVARVLGTFSYIHSSIIIKPFECRQPRSTAACALPCSTTADSPLFPSSTVVDVVTSLPCLPMLVRYMVPIVYCFSLSQPEMNCCPRPRHHDARDGISSV